MQKPIKLSDVQPGDVVYIERPIDARDSQGNPASNYGAGEYIVTQTGISTLRVVKACSDGYGLHEEKTFTVAGSDAWQIASCADGRRIVADAIETLKAFAVEVKSDKPKWVSYVYSQAASVASKLRRIFAERWGDEVETPLVDRGDGLVINGEFFPCPPGHRPAFV
jgi:hypothetical protein